MRKASGKISLLTLACFLFFITGPGQAISREEEAWKQKDEKDFNQAVIVDTESAENGMIEVPVEEPGGGVKKKFPWLLVVGGVIVVGAVLFLVLKKPKYSLTVSVGEGVSGTPVSGSSTHKKGTAISYSYSLQSGYSDLQVSIDGTAAAASGTITMDKNKSITASATRVATLVVNSSPTGAQIILDGTDSGKTTNHTFTFNTAGSHQVLLRKVGYKEHSESKTIALGATATVSKTLEAGLRELFAANATNSILWKWQPKSDGNWSVVSNTYRSNANVPKWNYSIYNLNWAATNYTLTVSMKRAEGSLSSSNTVWLGTTSSPTFNNLFYFQYTADGRVSIWKSTGYNLDTQTGTSSNPILSWTASPAVNTGLEVYNTLKIIRQGNNYTYYLNNQLISSFTDASLNPQYLIIGGYSGSVLTTLQFNYVYLDIGETSGSVPGPEISAVPAAGRGGPEGHDLK